MSTDAWDDDNENNGDMPPTLLSPLEEARALLADPVEKTASERLAAVEARRNGLRLWAEISQNIAEEQARQGRVR